MSDPVHPLTLWLARASMACYAGALLVVASRRNHSLPSGFQAWRILWSAACVLLIVHVLAAFHFEHHWSHSNAWAHTAQQTVRVTGINWGGGLYFNYAFLILWLTDVVCVWCRGSAAPLMLRRITSLVCVFMVVNATAVFGPSWWIAVVVSFVLVLIGVRRKFSGSSSDEAVRPPVQ